MLENYNVLFGGKVIAIHQDYFGLFDLISFCDGRYYFHQISNLENKAAKVKAIQARKMSGWVWTRYDEGRKVSVECDGSVNEMEARFRRKFQK